MGLFTIEFELGRETRAMIERVAADTRGTIERVATKAVLQLELGPKTRKTMEIAGVTSKGGGKAREAIGSLLGKGTDEATPAA